MPSWRQCSKSRFQGRDFIQSILKFFRNGFWILFKIHFQAGFFRFDGFMNIGFQEWFHPDYFPDMGKPDLTGGLRILPGFFKHPLGILQQGALAKHQRTIFFESLDDKYVAVLKRVARFPPLQFFGQPAAKDDPSQFLRFFLPVFGLAYKCINEGFCFHDHNFGKNSISATRPFSNSWQQFSMTNDE